VPTTSHLVKNYTRFSDKQLFALKQQLRKGLQHFLLPAAARSTRNKASASNLFKGVLLMVFAPIPKGLLANKPQQRPTDRTAAGC
jgi:hypothetical protein